MSARCAARATPRPCSRWRRASAATSGRSSIKASTKPPAADLSVLSEYHRTMDRNSQLTYKTIEDTVGDTPLVRLKRLAGKTSNIILLKLEGDNPAGSVKDRPAMSMIVRAEKRGTIKPGDSLIEATSGNTGIALAMAAAIRGYRMVLIMPEHLSAERRQTMRAFGAE